MRPDELRIRRRTLAISLAAAAGGALFVPFILASPGAPHISLARLVVYVALGAGSVTALAANFGLRWADRASLPMPFLRPWEYRQSIPWRNVSRITGLSIGIGILSAAGSTWLAHAVGIPANPGNVFQRVATAPFGGIVTEVIAHLFLMSGLVLAFRRKIPAILVSALVFVAVFHGSAVGLTPSVRYTVLFLNAAMGILTGVMYGSQGFEAAVLTHASAHAVVLAVN